MTSANANIEAIYPLSPTQSGILFHSLLSPEAPLYIQQYVCTFTGPLDVPAFRASWDVVIQRHEVLRSLLAWEGRDQPLQIVRREVTPEWQVHDWRKSDPSRQHKDFEDWLEADRSRGFDLEVAPLLRLALIRTGETTHRFVWTHHHIVIDGWSIGLVLNEVVQLYSAHVTGIDLELPPAPSYRQYVRWLKDDQNDGDEQHWRHELAGLTEATPIRIGETRDTPWAEAHGSVTVSVGAHATAALVEFGRGHGLTLNTMLRGAWGFLLSKYSGSTDVTFGATYSGRPPELAGSLETVGLFINTLPVRVAVAPDLELHEWLGALQQKQIESSQHEMTPLASVQGWSEIPSGAPLFESLLVVENVPNAGLDPHDLAVSEVQYLQRSNYPLAILAMPGADLELIFLFDRQRFDTAVIERMARQMAEVLRAMPESPKTLLRELRFFPEEELHEVLQSWNDTAAPQPDEQTIHGLITDVAQRWPDRLAVTGSGISLTYTELETRASAIAQALTGSGVSPRDRVAVLMPRCPEAIAAILGVLKAGCAYVPLDPELPSARIEFILRDTAATAVVASDGDEIFAADLTTITVASDCSLPNPVTESGATTTTTADDLAYVLYTSGSTGEPKGVAVSHRSLVSSTLARTVEYDAPVKSFLLLSPLVFDSSVAGLFSSLTQGGTLVIPAPRMEQDAVHISELIATHGVTHTLALPTVYQLLLELADTDQLRSLQLVMVAGEACPESLVRAHYEVLPETQLANEYGPTEATVWCTVHHVPPPGDAARDSGRVPIGRPITNSRVFLLDADGAPVPVGVPGEIHIGGAGVAEGYLGRPEQTAAAFVTRSLPGIGSIRLYRTGDIARHLPDGTLDLLGRADHQVKIRGQRIELGEIEAAMRRHPDVREAAVVVRQSPTSGAALAAYAETEVAEAEIRAFLADLFPRAMIPATIDTLESLPRGSTGKIDRGALPDPTAPPARRLAVAPSGPTEEALAAIWSDVLGLDRVSVNEDFFSLGGDSILSIRVIARSHRQGIRITPRQFFETPTISGLAAAVESPD